ncbi:hypothetical protein O9Z70_14480 [Devosia sp. YIM 151766]|uniref:hypothetical protein n=1 Tax=Devosia sp. YIM 151766 TaxID=3017325 RepID=UPI00255CE491|nr:hypothetical protein [Devosia sp. YIM 151766]WIY52643.1 hypothetical protein O9Z70_14480 [Devosia sp. YIM 151766]
MTNPSGIGPAVMITRIAQENGASLATQLAKVAELRMQMAIAQAEQADKLSSDEQAPANPINGAEVDLLI